MIEFQDGPAKGARLRLRRAPIYLRVVSAKGEIDALDQLDDAAEPGEEIYAYVMATVPSRYHLCARAD